MQNKFLNLKKCVAYKIRRKAKTLYFFCKSVNPKTADKVTGCKVGSHF